MYKNEKILHTSDVYEVSCAFEDIVAPHALRFEHPMAENVPLYTLLRRGRTLCLPLGEEIDASLCMQCDHFIGCRRELDGTVSLHCWTHRKTQETRM